MIVDQIRARAEKEAARRKPSMSPSGSQAGACAAALQQAQFPWLTHPAPWHPRGILVVQQGNVFEQWINHMIREAYPGLWGLEQQPFYYPVPLPDSTMMRAIEGRLRAHERDFPKDGPATPRRFWGWPIDDFSPPKVEKIGDRRFRIRGLRKPTPVEPAHATCIRLDDVRPDTIPPSIVLDRTNGIVYVTVKIDGVIDHPTLGMTVVEQKQMSNFAFRRAVLGNMEYRYRCQLMAEIVASGQPSALWVCTRKETMHMCEIGFRRDETTTSITFTAPTGQTAGYVVADPLKQTLRRATDGPTSDDGTAPEPISFLGDSEWETAQVWTPFDETTRADVDARILRVLLADGETWYREYGPDFTCPKCLGRGRRPCKPCQGSGTTFAKRKTGTVPVPCAKCAKVDAATYSGQLGWQRCQLCGATGQLAETTLPAYPCGYCATVDYCYGSAGVALKFEKGKPTYPITAEAFRASGITFHPPEPRVTLPSPEDEEDASEEETT